MKINLVIALFLTFVMAKAQNGAPSIGKVTGKVIDAQTNEPLQFATISLTHLKDPSKITGALADDKGNFKVEEMSFGPWKLTVSFIGYKDFTKEPILIKPGNTTINLGTIKVSSSANALEEVNIVAEKTLVETKIDRKVINVGKDLTNVGGSAEEVMANMPGIEVDMDGNISLRGNTNVTVLIDGKPSALTGGSRQAVLNQIPASAIESVEIITNPSAKYDPDGMAGIINIVLKKNRLKGISGSATATYGHDNNYNTNAALNYRNKKWNLYTNYAFRQSDRGRFSTGSRELFLPDSISRLDNVSTGNRIRFSHTITGGVDYNITDRSTVTLSGNYNLSGRDQFGNNRFENFDENEVRDLFFIRHNLDFEEETGYGINLYHDYNFKEKGRKLNSYITYSSTDEQGGNENSETFMTNDGFIDSSINPYQQDQFNHEIFTNLVQAFDYTHPLKNGGKIEAGTKYTKRIIDQNAEFYDDTTGNNETYGFVEELSNHFKYDEDVLAAYMTYGGSWDKLEYQAGLRAEQVYTASTLLNTGETFNNDYFQFYPSASLAYKKDLKSTFSLSYSRRVNRPGFWSLNPFVDYSNPFNIRSGNPFLRPEFINSYEFGYMRYMDLGMVSANVYYKSTNDMISRIVTVNEEGVTWVTWENYLGQQAFGLELSTNLNIAKKVRINASANLFQNIVDASNLDTDTDLSNSNFGYFGRLNVNYSPTKKWSFQGSTFYRGKRIFAIGYMDPIYGIDFAARYQIIDKKLSAIVQVKDAFDTRRFAIYTAEELYDQQRIYDSESRFVFVGFEYRFGKMKVNKRRQGGGYQGGGDDMGF